MRSEVFRIRIDPPYLLYAHTSLPSFVLARYAHIGLVEILMLDRPTSCQYFSDILRGHAPSLALDHKHLYRPHNTHAGVFDPFENRQLLCEMGCGVSSQARILARDAAPVISVMPACTITAGVPGVSPHLPVTAEGFFGVMTDPETAVVAVVAGAVSDAKDEVAADVAATRAAVAQLQVGYLGMDMGSCTASRSMPHSGRRLLWCRGID